MNSRPIQSADLGPEGPDGAGGDEAQGDRRCSDGGVDTESSSESVIPVSDEDIRDSENTSYQYYQKSRGNSIFQTDAID